MPTDRLTIQRSTPIRDSLRGLSKSSGKSEPELARTAIVAFLQRVEAAPSCYEVALKAGLIGCFNSGLGDLSTNPKYMQGFGEAEPLASQTGIGAPPANAAGYSVEIT